MHNLFQNIDYPLRRTVRFIWFFGLVIRMSLTGVIGQSTCGAALPLTIGTQQCGTNNNVGSFPDSGGNPKNPCNNSYNDGEYWFKVTGTDKMLKLDVTGLTATWSGLFVLDNCPGSSPACVASFARGSSTLDYSLTTPILTNGQTYYIVIANWSSPYSTNFCLLGTWVNPGPGGSCVDAVAITEGYTGSVTTPGNGGIEDWVTSADATCGSASNSAFSSSDVYLYSYTTGSTAGEAFYFTLNHDYVLDDEHAIGVWKTCTGSALSNCVGSTYKFDNVVGICAQDLDANTTYYIGVGKQYGTDNLKYDVIDFTVETSSTIPSNDCASAPNVDITDPYVGSTRCNYTASAGSPSGCGTIENDAWVQFVASATTAVIDYAVENCTYDYGVQLAAFSGNCGSQTLISGSCLNYAANNSSGTWNLTGLTIGATYYLRADGYAGDLCSYAYTPISGVALPVSLVDLEGENLENGFSRITWSTLTEINNDLFSIEKSEDGVNFRQVGTVKGAGSAIKKNNYYFIDRNTNERYYRIRQIDFDGKSSLSEIIFIQEGKEVNNALPSPNPFTTSINLNDPNASNCTIYDVTGKPIRLFQEIEGSLDLSTLTKGTYILTWWSGNEFKTERIIKH